MPTRKLLRGVIFDWDGTLLDSYRADASAYLQMFHAMGIRWGLTDLSRHYSPDWHTVYRAAQLPQERWGEADCLWRRYYRLERPALRSGARRVVQQLAAAFRLGLVTSGSAWRVRAQLQTFGLDRFFAARVFGDAVPRRKPHPAQLRIVLGRLGLEPAACVYVGDAPEDVQMAKRAGVFVIGVVGNSPVPDRLRAARPDALVPSLEGLLPLLGN
jgi:HAD superfamily hydrolase (TIGR01509 family)